MVDGNTDERNDPTWEEWKRDNIADTWWKMVGWMDVSERIYNEALAIGKRSSTNSMELESIRADKVKLEGRVEGLREAIWDARRYIPEANYTARDLLQDALKEDDKLAEESK